MEYVHYLRELALHYREQAADAADPDEAAELDALATVCEDVALTVEDRAASG